MTGKKIKVLIVDDSAFMRRVIKQMLETDPGIEAIGTARDGAEGVELALSLNPDVITMDIEMPRMTGLEATEAIMEKAPTPIIMVSSLTKEGAKATFEALDKGAADYISKNLSTSSFDMIKIQEELIAKVKAVSLKKNRLMGLTGFKKPEAARIPAPMPSKRSFATQKIAFVAIGASTGGPRAIQEVLSHLPSDLSTPFLVAIHMPRAFTGAFAERLNDLCGLEVKEAENGETIKAGRVLLTPGGSQTRVKRRGTFDFSVEINNEPFGSVYKPSVDVSMSSVAECYPGRSLGVILTGMGHDGREGMRLIKEKGGKTLVQSEETCTVYGMPKAVVDAGLADKVVPLDHIAGEIVNMI
ncbi:MAG: chemotaxis response regulator protein-glutamate methylesterase [Deltaproteobacteria bacterium]|nr:chemotaxis response regulator protein-glutamate methylesterase [Deltaproteobacteria bacterium]